MVSERLSGGIACLMLAGLLCAPAHGAPAGQTAYAAIRTVQQSYEQAITSRLLEISGVQGASQPLVWRIVVADPNARGGFREFEVSGGSLLSERAPVRSGGNQPPRTPIDMSRLNMDSDGAFIAAHNTAKQMRIGFDSANYQLRAGGAQGEPVWLIELVDLDGTLDGIVEISADDGLVLRAERADGRYRQPDDPQYGMGGALGAASRTLGKVGESTRRGVLRGAGTVQEWLTGRRTIDEGVD